jgi:hypothetical protein
MANIVKDAENLKPLHTIDGRIKRYDQYEKQYQGFTKKLKIKFPSDRAISFLGIYPKELKLRSRGDICTAFQCSIIYFRQ